MCPFFFWKLLRFSLFFVFICLITVTFPTLVFVCLLFFYLYHIEFSEVFESIKVWKLLSILSSNVGLPNSLSSFSKTPYVVALLIQCTNHWDSGFFLSFFSSLFSTLYNFSGVIFNHWLFYFQHGCPAYPTTFLSQILYFSLPEFPFDSFLIVTISLLRYPVYPFITNIYFCISLSIFITAKLNFLCSNSGVWVISVAFPLDYVSSNFRCILDIVKNTW